MKRIDNKFRNESTTSLQNFKIEELEERLEMAKWSVGISSETSSKTGTKVYASMNIYF